MLKNIDNNKLRYSTLKIFLLTVLLVFVSAQPASAKQYQWQLAQSWPKDFPIYGDAVKNFVDLVGAMSNGRIQIEIVNSREHKRPLEILQMVKEGEFDMGHTASYYEKGYDINTLFFTALPFGFIPSEKFAWFYHGGGYELMRKAYQKHGVYAYPGGNSSNQMGGWFQKEITSLDDLKGLKMRIPGLAGDVIKTLGVEVTNLPPGELYSALESGKLDALEWVGPSLDLGMGFHKIAPYYYTGWHEPGTELFFYLNQKLFDSLPKDLQNIVTVAMRVSSYDMYARIQHESAINLHRIRTEYPNIKIRSFPSEVTRALSKETQRQIDELASQGDALTREIVDSMRSYKDKVRVWTRISDQAYLNNSGL